MKQIQKILADRGLSNLEVAAALTSVALVGAFGLSMVWDLGSQESEASAKRAAKILAATAENARVAGDQTIGAAMSKEEAISLLADGVAGEGAFQEFEYRVSLSEKRQKNVLPYLNFEGGNLVYDGDADID